MEKSDRNAIFTIVATVIVAAGVALAGSQGGAAAGGVPVFALCVALAFVIQWLVFIPAFVKQTEKYFDLTGSLTYISISTLALIFSPGIDARAVLVWALVVTWETRSMPSVPGSA